MLKALALDNFWSPSFSKTKKQGIKLVKTQSPLRYWFAVGLVALNAVLLMSYIYGVNKYASSGYEIKTLQNRLAAMNLDNKKINLKVSEASSMVSIQSDFLSSNFIVSGTPKFLLETQLTQR